MQSIFCYLVVGDYKEGYYIGVEVPEDDPEADKPFYGPNIWPPTGKKIMWFYILKPCQCYLIIFIVSFISADILPGWRDTMEKYHQKAL